MSLRIIACAAGAAFVLFVEARAHAQSAEAPAAPAVPGQEASLYCYYPCREGAFLHDGFYSRLSLGIGYAAVTGEGPEGDASIAGLGSSTVLALGGTLGRGFVLGGAYGVVGISGDFEGAPIGADGDTDAFAELGGVFFDWHPRPAGGWHFGGVFGFGRFVIEDSESNDYSGTAPAGVIMVGHDQWIGPEHSLGSSLVLQGMLPASAEDDRGDDTGYRFGVVSLALQFSLLYH